MSSVLSVSPISLSAAQGILVRRITTWLLGISGGEMRAMKNTHALVICLIAFASPSLAETDPVSYEEFLAENDISFTSSEILEEYRSFRCEENDELRGYIRIPTLTLSSRWEKTAIVKFNLRSKLTSLS